MTNLQEQLNQAALSYFIKWHEAYDEQDASDISQDPDHLKGSIRIHKEHEAQEAEEQINNVIDLAAKQGIKLRYPLMHDAATWWFRPHFRDNYALQEQPELVLPDTLGKHRFNDVCY